MSAPLKKRLPPGGLRIDTPVHNPFLVAVAHCDVASLSSADSGSDFVSPFRHPPLQKARSLRNMKNLSLSISSAQSSTLSLQLPPSEPQSAASNKADTQIPPANRLRRPSIISLPSSTNPTSLGLHRKEEDGSPTVPYHDGPIQIIPGVWLGSEDNARDWKGLIERGIKSVLNVAKEVVSPFDSALQHRQHLRPFASTPNLKQELSAPDAGQYYPPHPTTGRPGLHYLKLAWSHGQQDLVDKGFPIAMQFVDRALKERNEGVLIHCQCGISRSATLVIALVMRAAAASAPSVPPEVWELKGMQGAYSFVKSKSRWAGPNMSLIYQLQEYERRLDPSHHSRSRSSSVTSSLAEEEEEWGRRRRLLDEASSDAEPDEECDNQVQVMKEEAKALDKAMEDRIVARKASVGSLAPSLTSSTGVGMGPAWRSRYGGSGRKRAGSVASNLTSAGNSVISEDLVEEEEEQELLGVGGGFDGDESDARGTSIGNESSVNNSPHDELASYSTKPRRQRVHSTTSGSSTSSLRPPPSAPIWKTTFQLPPAPRTSMRSTFDLPPVPVVSRRPANRGPGKRRPTPLGILPPVPSSPIAIITNQSQPASPPGYCSSKHSSLQPPSITVNMSTPQRLRVRTESGKPLPPPLRISQSSSTNVPPRTPLRSFSQHSHSHSVSHSLTSSDAKSRTSSHSRKSSFSSSQSSHPHTHHVTNSSQPPPTATQTLFVFPPSPTSTPLASKTPSTMTLVSTPMPGIPFPTLTQAGKGNRTKRRSWINGSAAIPPTPTTACSRVDARGWVGLE